MRRFAAPSGLGAIALLAAACATNPVTGRQQLMLISEEEAIAASAKAYAATLAPLVRAGRVDSDPAQVARVRAITERLIPHAIAYRPETAHWAWSVRVIDDPKMVNAWCMAGGKMAVYTGLLRAVRPTDDELAQVMGHEIAHALSKHTVEKMSVALATQTGVAVVGAVAGQYGGVALQGASLAALLAIDRPNSRTAESEADRIGIELAARAGYHPRAAVTLWEKMGRLSGGSDGLEFLSTHPSPARRTEELAALVPRMMPFYEATGERPVYRLKPSPER